LGLESTGDRVGRFLGRLWRGVQGVVSALPERIIEGQTESYEEEQALKQFGPAARDRVLVEHLSKNVNRMEHEMPGLVPGVNSVRQAKRLVREVNAGNEEGAVDALGDLAFSVMGDVTVLKGATAKPGGSARSAASARTWQDFLPEAQRRLEIAKAEYGDAAIYAMDGVLSPSAILRANMKSAGVKPPPFPNAAHHIVAVEAEAAAAARAHLEKLGIDINDAANGVFMRYTEKGLGPSHLDIHTKAYYAEVNQRILGTTSAGEARTALGNIASQMQQGTFPY
jgi:hypothetical protein